MINIGVVCHSSEIADSVIKFVEIFKNRDFKIVNLGKSKKLELGTTVSEIVDNFRVNNNGNPYLVFVDMGSSIDNLLEAKKKLEKEIVIEITSAPLLEGLITAVTANDDNIDLDTLKGIAEESRFFEKIRGENNE